MSECENHKRLSHCIAGYVSMQGHFSVVEEQLAWIGYMLSTTCKHVLSKMMKTVQN